MKKTNLRIQNFFIIEHKNKYYLSDIDNLEDWKSIHLKELKLFLKNDDITEILKNSLIKHKMNSNVNFILNNFNSSKYNSNNQEKSPVKVVKLSKKTKQSGGI